MKSPIKWTGGKRREIPYFSSYIPQNFDIYIEPFSEEVHYIGTFTPKCNH